MTPRFLSWEFKWRRVPIGILIGVMLLFLFALLLIYLAHEGLLTRI